MLWYLLYPLRGTTEAPVLDPNHPFRRLCTRYATWAARHVKTVLPLSGAVVFLFLYLFPFLYARDATDGASLLPRNVWADTHPLRGGPAADADVIVQSAWIHGSYMKALDRDLLLAALDLQDRLLGPAVDFDPRRPQPHGFPPLADAQAGWDRRQRDALHLVYGLTDESWFFHSPLQYWRGSADVIAADPDLIATVNAKKLQTTSVNTTLRHCLVFSGERFDDRRLVGADALVITLVHRKNSPVGRQWARAAEELARAAAAEGDVPWRVIPPDGRASESRLYRIQFRPMSWFDMTLLTTAYSLIILNMLLRLSKFRAVKSRFGLMVTILVQVAAAILSSFSVCAVLKIDLARVPYYAYPLVVLAISMENSFRLINAVVLTSSAISNSDRIGEAFGSMAHIAVASHFHNWLVLYALSRVTSTSISAFCTFAAIAILFDFFYLTTFFLSVLSVDMRQRELWELERASLKRSKRKRGLAQTPAHSWRDAFFPTRIGETTTPTRIAGTVVVLSFVLVAQAYYNPTGDGRWLSQMFNLFQAVPRMPQPAILADINQARSPDSWLRIQDHETAREVIQVLRPGAHSFVARIYSPIVFVLKGADRTPDMPESRLPPGMHTFLDQLPRFAAWLLLMLAALRQFTNHLIKDRSQDNESSGPADGSSVLSVRALSKGHTLDVAMLTASPDGRLVSVGLDRAIQVWDVPSGARARVLSDPEVPLENPFPVLSMALDDRAAWLALVTWQRVFLWSVERNEWAGTRDVDLGGHRPEAVYFATKGPGVAPSLVLVRRNGIGLEIEIDKEEAKDFVICKTPLVWAVSFAEKCHSQPHAPPAILTLSRKGCIHLVRQRDDEWVSTEVQLGAERETRDAHSLVPIPGLSMYMVGRSRSVDLVDVHSSAIVHTFVTEPMKARTLKPVCWAGSQQPGLASFTLAYISDETGDLIVQTCLPDPDGAASHFGSCPAPSSPPHPWAPTKEAIQRIARPGVWEALPSGNVVGVRQKLAAGAPVSPTAPSAALGLRKRMAASSSRGSQAARSSSSTPAPQGWEAWVLSLHGDDSEGPRFETRPLEDEATADADGPNHFHHHLLISEPGPITRLGAMSAAVGMGDMIKVVSVGIEYFFDQRDGAGGGGVGVVGSGGGSNVALQALGVGSRRKRPGGGLGRARKESNPAEPGWMGT
ncbi:hypothetical protein VTJ83DRAFT_5720 [Remersonia thermophila]|uniref:Sterol regulatory element-binding protein cleavage-activating protein n=1 Tax=Remersonia thermophila TaxID=72144 RepID=A0ABR4D7S1_9PEZI